MSNDFERKWLSDLPTDWPEKRADFLGNPYRITVDPDVYGDELVAHYSIPQVQQTGGPYVEPASDIGSTKLLIKSPTLLVSKLNPRKRTICIAEPHPEHPTLASSEFVAINCEQMDRRYAYYLWQSEKITDRLSAIVQSATRSHQRVNPADILKLPWKWPLRATQRRIARFLDEKTAKIDGLIEKKRALLDLLAEKRQVLITRAVTKGIEPGGHYRYRRGDRRVAEGADGMSTFPMRRLRFVCEEPLKYGANAAAQYDDPEWPRFVRITDISDSGQLKDDTFRSLPLDAAKDYLLEEGDILLARSGSIGRSFIYKPEWGDACFAGYLVRARLSEEFDPQFVYWSLNTLNYWSWIESTAIRSTIQNISAERYAEYAVPAPPLATQRRTARFLDEKTAEIDGLHDLVVQSVDKLAEYRSALITAAVTGQLAELQ